MVCKLKDKPRKFPSCSAGFQSVSPCPTRSQGLVVRSCHEPLAIAKEAEARKGKEHQVGFETSEFETRLTQVVVVFITCCVYTHETLQLTYRNTAKFANG